MEPNAPLASDMGTYNQYKIISMIGGNGVQLDKERDRSPYILTCSYSLTILPWYANFAHCDWHCNVPERTYYWCSGHTVITG